MSLLKKSIVWPMSILVVFTLLVPLLIPQTASANHDKDPYQNMCVPQMNELNSDLSPEAGTSQDGDNRAEHFSPKGGWLTVKVVDRSRLDITISDSGTCQSPLRLNLDTLSSSQPGGSAVSLKSLLDATLTDINLDGDFDYRHYTGDGQARDESRIDNFGDFPNRSLIDGAEMGSISIDEITGMFATSELFLSFEEDLVDFISCGDTNNNFILRKQHTPGIMAWDCHNDILGGGPLTSNWTGVSIFNSIETPENFNITFYVRNEGGDATKLEYVGDNDRARHSFTWCPNKAEPAYISNGCNGDFMLSPDITPEFFSSNSHTISYVDVTDLGFSMRGQIGVAGANTDSAITSESQVGNYERTCQSEGGPFSFIICPMLDWGNVVIQSVDNRIRNALEVDSKYYSVQQDITNPTTGETKTTIPVKDAWARFRNIAYVLLIPIMLVMVIGTALGFSFVDAYTVKRAMPRLLIAVIFMALSYDIAKIMIEVTNTVGRGVAGLVATPFGGPEALRLSEIFGGGFGGGLIVTSIGGGLVAGVAATAMVPGAIGFLASVLFTAALAIIIIFALLTIRELIIVFLIILSPIAILSWIFPGNDKLWKLWWNSFSKLLMLYPLIIGLLVTGRGFASLVGQDSSGNGFEQVFIVLVKLVAYLGPFFFIPVVFKAAGGAVGNLLGQVNDRSKGVFDRQKKFRQARRAEIGQRRKNYSMFNDSTKLGRGLNTITGAASNPRNILKGRKGIAAGRQAGRANSGAENLKNDSTFQANQNDDTFLLALANEKLAQQKIAEDQAAYDAAVASGDTDTANSKRASLDARKSGLAAAKQVSTRHTAATRTAALETLAKTGYQFSDGEKGYKELASTVESITGGDAGQTAALMNGSQFHLRNAGRYDLAGINHGAGYDLDRGLGKAGLYQLANGKPESLKAWGSDLAYKTGPMTDEEKTQASIQHKELKAMLPSTTGAVRDEALKQIEALEAHGVKQFNSDTSGYIDPTTGLQTQVATQQRFDATLAQTDAAYAAQFTVADRRQGFKTTYRDQTRGEYAESQARSYERPDPNNM